jgi:hypothetical protein
MFYDERGVVAILMRTVHEYQKNPRSVANYGVKYISTPSSLTEI